VAAASWAGAVNAQARIGAATQPRAPVATPGVATFGMPNPAGLTSRFPAGLPSPNPPQLDSPVTPNISAPGTAAPGSAPVDGGIAPATNVLGGGAAEGVAPGRFAAAAGVYGWSAVDIARSFLLADTNRDGELTRAEAQRLTIMPSGFDDMDRNHDGVITRFEYDDAVR
jgi:hypothetical protein